MCIPGLVKWVSTEFPIVTGNSLVWFPLRGGRLAPGFTLIEILVVMAVIALLLSVALPRYFTSLEKSRVVTLQENLKVLRITLDRFHADKQRYPESLEELVEERYLRSVPVDPITESSRTWILVPSSEEEISGIVDVHSGAQGNTRDGIAYGAL